MNLRGYLVAVCLGIVFVVQGCAQVLGLDEEREFVVPSGGTGGIGGGGAGGNLGCGDGDKNGTETDADCGGMDCDPCGNGKNCLISADCLSNVCNGVCLKPTCDDGVVNGGETGEDCGGSCEPCKVGQPCSSGTDCETLSCVDGTCQAPTCTDMVANGAETDEDCGGGVCPKCVDLSKCLADSDCQSDVCKNSLCQAPTCTDTVQNGEETDINCGGTQCQPCTKGQQCVIDDDCETKRCVNQVCEEKEIGTACGDKIECLSTFCVDGVCCDSACTTTCQACSTAAGAAADGACGNIAQNMQDSFPANACTTAGFACDGVGKCKQINGNTCTMAAQCISGNCVDGVCCNSACTTACQACSTAAGAAVNGTCGNIAQNMQDSFPVNACTGVGACNGSGLCVNGLGVACTLASQCASGNCVDGRCCDTACSGTCQACSVAAGTTVNGTCGNINSGTQDNFPANTCVTPSTCDGAGNCKKTNGQTCAVGAECVSNFCVDGVCCNSACITTCQACSTAAGAAVNGTCGNITSGTQDNVPANACTTAGSACDGAGNCKQINGNTCTMGAQCIGGNCVDGVCCGSASCGMCQTCNKTLMLAGMCQNIDLGQPDNVPANTCVTPSACDGNGACKKNNGQTCAAGSECLSTNCVDGVCCNTACSGTCQACSTAAGGSTNGVCGNIAAGMADNFPANTCVGTTRCDDAGNCKKQNGQTCVAGSECVSTNCVDSVCCNTACTSACQACSTAAGAAVNGTCGNITSGTQDNFPANTCNGNNACNGSGACKKTNGQTCSGGTECISTNCVDGVCCNTLCTTTCQACSIAAGGATDGTCGNIGPGYQDNFPANACTGSNACNGGSGGGACVAKSVNGTSCSMNSNCASNNCVDGVCCNSSCNTACFACSTAAGGAVNGTCGVITTAGTDDNFPANVCTGTMTCDGAGTCKKEIGQTCMASSDCANGNCIDGHCCKTSCSGTCQACNVAGSLGTCSNTPVGTMEVGCNGSQACNGMGSCKSLNGITCSTGTECVSTFCADGFCCNMACAGTCQACSFSAKGSGVNGQCGAIGMGLPDNFPANTCVMPMACNGMGMCL